MNGNDHDTDRNASPACMQDNSGSKGDAGGSTGKATAASNGDEKVIPLRKPRPCPICKARSHPRWHPFCSRRCADVDLHRWLSGSYVISNTADDESAADEDAVARHNPGTPAHVRDED